MKKTILVLGITLALLSSATASPADQLIRPEGPGPFPAVVLMHGCGGVLPLYADWGNFLRDNGYVSLVVDSLGPRGLGAICNDIPLMTRMASDDRVKDAYKALSYLKTLPFVDGQGVALMGWSHGAGTALEAVAEEHPEQFRAAIAMYPYCRDSLSSSRVPSLILIGEWDDWTPSKNCEAMKARVPSLSLKVYPATNHHFDDPRYGRGGIVYLGHALQYNEQSSRDAHVQVLQFLSKHLR